MPNYRLTINVNIYAREAVVLEADDEAQARAALEAYLGGDGPYLENMEHVDWEVTLSTVAETDEAIDGGRAVDWLS